MKFIRLIARFLTNRLQPKSELQAILLGMAYLVFSALNGWLFVLVIRELMGR